MGFIAILDEGRWFWRRKFSSPDIIQVTEEAGYEGQFLHPAPGGSPFLRDKATVYATPREAEAAGWAIIQARDRRAGRD
jgi:hypothetical protein